MKAFIFTAAMFLAVTPALAQNQPTTTNTTAPNNINHAPRGVPGYRSGAESQPAARGEPARIIGRSRYCAQVSAQILRCNFRTMAACRKSGRQTSLSCVANPRVAVGSGRER